MIDRWLVFTDLDGTLLNHHDYNYDAALPMLNKLQQAHIPVILNTSKTYAELTELSDQLGLKHPFIVENGSAIFIPEGYFSADFESEFLFDAHQQQGYLVLTLGESINRLNDFIHRVGPAAINFSECSLQQAVELTGLSETEARNAQTRLFSVPLVFEKPQQEIVFRLQSQKAGLACLKGGRFLHLLGLCDKGASMLALKKLYEIYIQQSFGVIALGDGQNDVAMLEQADIPVVVKSPSSPSLSIQPLSMTNSATIYTTLEAPEGWTEGLQAALNIIPFTL